MEVQRDLGGLGKDGIDALLGGVEAPGHAEALIKAQPRLADGQVVGVGVVAAAGGGLPATPRPDAVDPADEGEVFLLTLGQLAPVEHALVKGSVGPSGWAKAGLGLVHHLPFRHAAQVAANVRLGGEFGQGNRRGEEGNHRQELFHGVSFQRQTTLIIPKKPQPWQIKRRPRAGSPLIGRRVRLTYR